MCKSNLANRIFIRVSSNLKIGDFEAVCLKFVYINRLPFISLSYFLLYSSRKKTPNRVLSGDYFD